MTDPTLTISIDRTGMSGSPGPLVFSGTRDGNARGITRYQEPAMQPRIRYATPSEYQHGDEPLSWTWQQTILGWDFAPTAASENAARVLIAEVVAAVSRLEFAVTVTVAGASAEVWRCNTGTVTPLADRSRMDLVHHDPVWSVNLPAYPVRTIP